MGKRKRYVPKSSDAKDAIEAAAVTAVDPMVDLEEGLDEYLDFAFDLMAAYDTVSDPGQRAEYRKRILSLLVKGMEWEEALSE